VLSYVASTTINVKVHRDMKHTPPFHERVSESLNRLSPAERRVARFIQENREEVLVTSATALALKTGTSDATVVRTTQTLGYAGINELRQQLAAELRQDLSLSSRLARTLTEVGDNPEAAFELTLDTHLRALESLRRDITPALIQRVVARLNAARRVFIFGIGPSSAMANYFAIQLGRFGLDGDSLTHTGLLLADGLHRLRNGDLLVMLAYGRIYRELSALLDHAKDIGIATVLITDNLGPALRKRVDDVLPVARGRADTFSMHTATLALIEALLVGIATKRQSQTIASLKSLNGLRAKIVGQPMDLPASDGSSDPVAAGLRERPKRKN
jgi:DNA-binding MurR/RpiR family transcriptional regulator